MKTKVIALAVLGTALTCSGGVAVGDDYLTTERLRALFEVERTVRWQAAKGGLRGVAHFRPDGNVQTSWNEPARSGSDAGRWRSLDGQFCIEYQNVHGGRERCYRMKAVGPTELLAIGGEGSPAFTYFLD